MLVVPIADGMMAWVIGNAATEVARHLYEQRVAILIRDFARDLGSTNLHVRDVTLRTLATCGTSLTNQISIAGFQCIYNFVRGLQQTASASAAGSQSVDAVANQMLRIAEKFGESESPTSDHAMDEI